MQQKRKWSCKWCRYLHDSGKYVHNVCTFYPIWEEIYDPELHFCGQHEWNKEANAEIRKQIMEDQ